MVFSTDRPAPMVEHRPQASQAGTGTHLQHAVEAKTSGHDTKHERRQADREREDESCIPVIIGKITSTKPCGSGALVVLKPPTVSVRCSDGTSAGQHDNGVDGVVYLCGDERVSCRPISLCRTGGGHDLRSRAR